MGYGIFLALVGVLAASNLIIARRPDAREAIAKLTPYQGWIGVGAALSGILQLISALTNIGVLTLAPIAWITWVATGGVLLALGLLLGIGVMKTFIKNPSAQAKLDDTVTRLAPYQGTLGLVAIGVGVWCVIASIVL